MSSSDDTMSKVAPFLDAHMQLKLIGFMSEKSIFGADTLAAQKARVLATTAMFAEAKAAGVPDAVVAEKEKAFVAKFSAATGSSAYTKLTAFFADVTKVESMKEGNGLTIDAMTGVDAEFTLAALDAYAGVAKMLYEQGKYGEAESILCNYVSVGRGQGADAIPLSILWGKLAARVMQGKVCEAIADFNVLKHAIEHKSVPAIDQLHHRSWLLHWGLFLQFGVTPDDTSPEIFNDRYYLQTIENSSPWILRYYACSVVLFGRRKTAINDLLRELRHIKHEYSDCFTEFMQCLYEQFDFGDAQLLLKTCVETMKKDFFLQNYAERFVEQARMLICEVYCQLNRTVELSTLATKLQLSEDEAEHWMVEMVRNASVSTVSDARIDSSGKKVLMSAPEPTGRSAVADATRDLSVRSVLMASQLEKVLAEQSLYAKATK